MQDRRTLELLDELATLEERRWPAVRAAVRGPRMETPPTPTPPAPTPPASTPPAPTPPAPTPPAPAPPAPTPTPPAAEWKPPTKDEWEAQQRATAEANKRLRALERQGQTEEEKNAAAAAQLEKVGGALKTSAIASAVSEVATRLRFQYPDLAKGHISLEGLEAELDLDSPTPSAKVADTVKSTIESRLKEVAEKYPGLVGAPPQRQMPGAGAVPPGGQAPAPAGQSAGHAAMNQQIRSAAGRGG